MCGGLSLYFSVFCEGVQQERQGGLDEVLRCQSQRVAAPRRGRVRVVVQAGLAALLEVATRRTLTECLPVDSAQLGCGCGLCSLDEPHLAATRTYVLVSVCLMLSEARHCHNVADCPPSPSNVPHYSNPHSAPRPSARHVERGPCQARQHHH